MFQVTSHTQRELEMIRGNFKGKDIVSFDQFSTEDIDILFDVARQMKRIVINNEPSHILEGLLVSLLFYEPSSRTFGSFAAAVKRLGGQTLEILNPEMVSSVSKGETFEDTIRVFEAYSNAIVLRHKIPGAARLAAGVAEFLPVINAGDGNNEHPTQTLLDLYTLYEHFGRLDNLTGLLAGDALNSRTMHSLIRGLSLYKNNTLYVLSPQSLRLSREDMVTFQNRGIRIIEISREQDIPRDCHFWYWTRVQRERFRTQEAWQDAQKEIVIATPNLLDMYAGKDTILMDPLPRVESVDPAVDADERAVYLRSQIRNGVYTRMALLALVLGRL
ncbi:MAG TPA: aspartate carbamoyltransferase [Dictyobacter sp.]|jgi:aspartate carbamoyltransferase|nr:aspartate carbamoyltransferase [Dictyobacter sp.]